jgi:hypothetical protein
MKHDNASNTGDTPLTQHTYDSTSQQSAEDVLAVTLRSSPPIAPGMRGWYRSSCGVRRGDLAPSIFFQFHTIKCNVKCSNSPTAVQYQFLENKRLLVQIQKLIELGAKSRYYTGQLKPLDRL